MDVQHRLEDWLFSLLVLPTHPADPASPSSVSELSEQPSAPSEPPRTIATADTFASLEETQAFTVKNLTTGEMLDLRDENKPDFAMKYASLLRVTDAERVESYL